MRYLRQSTTVTIQMGPFLDKTDGVTEETALTPGIEVSKAGAAFAARNSATAVSHDAEGWYRVELNATDTGTLGPLMVKAHDNATHLPVWHEFMVVPANYYDSIVAGSDKLQVDLTQIDGAATNGNNATLNLAQLNIQNSAGPAVVMDTTSISDVTVNIANNAAFGADAVVVQSQAGAAFNAIGGTTAGFILQCLSGTGAIISSQGGNGHGIQLNGSGTGSGLSGTIADLRTLGLDHLLSAAVSGSDVTNNSVIAKLVSASATADWDDYDNTTDSLQANQVEHDATQTAVGAISAPTAAAVADAVWDEARSGHVAEGSFGQSFAAVINGQAATGTLSTTQATTNLTEATDNHYNDRVVVWVSGVLAGQACQITDYDGATKMLTYTTLTEAPSNGDKFVIV